MIVIGDVEEKFIFIILILLNIIMQLPNANQTIRKRGKVRPA